ncbi:MAG TPA: efflux RND transporter periplasmic adaptor subunit [Planctomycetaceae bacterium]|nr:efflux RND transporter periplasmic adaptor subunit [Planctomycetaceae bacterium]
MTVNENNSGAPREGRPFRRPLVRLAKLLIPTLAIVGGLVAAAAIKGWPVLPSVSRTRDAGTEAFCGEHGVPESLCVICHPELKDRLEWCEEHGLPEALCTRCNSKLRETLATCAEHGLPPAFCPDCGRLDAGPHEERTTEGSPKTLDLGPAPLPGQDGASSEKPAELCQSDLPMVKLASPDTVRNAGLQVVAVGARLLDPRVTCNGRAEFQQNRFALVRPRVEGVVTEVRVDVGDSVQRGEVMAVVDSAQLGEAKADFLAALALLDLAQQNHDRLKRLADKQIIAGKAMIAAETRLREARISVDRARQRLLNLRISNSEIDRFAREGDTSSLLPIPAPRDGVVVRRSVAVGEAVVATSELFAVADLTTLWVYLDLYEQDSRSVRVGQPVRFQVDSLPGLSFDGQITWVSPEVNPATRTIRVRAEVQNRDGLLRAGMYGIGVIETDAPSQALVVPKAAVQWHQRQPVVFVKRGETLFEPRRIVLGRKAGPFWEVVEGLQPGEPVVTTGSFLLKTELMKGSIGAGCCE